MSANPKRKREELQHLKGMKQPKAQLQDDATSRKFNSAMLGKKNILTCESFKTLVLLNLHTQKWYHIFLNLNSTAVSAATWNKYSCGHRWAP
jgi:hypothetical protein